jgi:hypothetical protein
MPRKDLAMSAVRRSTRFRVALDVPVKIGHKEGTLVDISEKGALATHADPVTQGTTVDMTFTYKGLKFHAKCFVESTTVVGVGAGHEKGKTLYATKLVFNDVSPASERVLYLVVGLQKPKGKSAGAGE